MVKVKVGAAVVRVCDAALARVDSVSPTTVVVSLINLGSAVLSHAEFRAQFIACSDGDGRRGR